FQTSSHDRLLALVSEGLGVAFVPASAVSDPRPPGLAVLPVSPGIERTVGAVWRADHRPTPAANAFLALLRDLRHADEQFAVQDADPAVRVGRPLAPRRGDRVDVLLRPQSAREELLGDRRAG